MLIAPLSLMTCSFDGLEVKPVSEEDFMSFNIVIQNMYKNGYIMSFIIGEELKMMINDILLALNHQTTFFNNMMGLYTNIIKLINNVGLIHEKVYRHIYIFKLVIEIINNYFEFMNQSMRDILSVVKINRTYMLKFAIDIHIQQNNMMHLNNYMHICNDLFSQSIEK